MMKEKLLLLSFMILLGSSAAGASIKVQLKGRVTSTHANGAPISEVQVGDEVTGQFSFSTTATDDMPMNPNEGLYKADQLEPVGQGFRIQLLG